MGKKIRIDEIMLVLIVALIAMIAGVSNKINKTEGIEAEKITKMILDDHSLSFASNSVVDEAKLKEIQNIGYSELKKSLKVKNDFCVYIEDWNGNVILAKGSSRLNKDGIVCRE